MRADDLQSRVSIRRHLAVGIAIVLFLAVGVGGWAATTSLSGAIIGHGTVVVDSYVKPIQHASGGIVAQLNVRNGDIVEAGDILLRLDDTQIKAGLAIVENGLDELSIREARLKAELVGADALIFPETLSARSDDFRLAILMDSEQGVFATRKSTLTGQQAQLRERISQIENEITGYTAQIDGNRAEADLIAQELGEVQSLLAKSLVPRTRVRALERELAGLTGAYGSLIAAVAKARGQISEIRLQILQIDSEARKEVSAQIREVQAQIDESVEKQVAARDELSRLDVRSPQSGIVHDLAVHSVDAIVGAGDAIMRIVPITDNLVVEAKFAPQDIDQIAVGQATILHFSAFNQSTTPQVAGNISAVAADLSYDQRTGASYYLTRIATLDSELNRLGKVTIIPGMPVEVFVQTGERTALSYLLKPLADQIERAFKGE